MSSSSSAYRGVPPFEFEREESTSKEKQKDGADEKVSFIYEYVDVEDSEEESDGEEDRDDELLSIEDINHELRNAKLLSSPPDPIEQPRDPSSTDSFPSSSSSSSSTTASTTAPVSTMEPMRSKKKPPKGPLLRQEIMARNKFSSTSTLFVSNTISNPNSDEIMRCMAGALYSHIERGCSATKKVYFQIFSEAHHPLTKDPLDLISTPELRTVHKFISTIYSVMKLDLECMIMCLAYVERLMELSGITLDQTNWRRVILSCLITAAKVWEDLSVYNIDFLSFFNNITVGDLNRMELVLLNLVQFQVGIPASLYAKYYFELRTLSKLDESSFPLKPLDKEGAKRLEKRSKNSEDIARLRFKKTASLTQLPGKSTARSSPAVLN